GRTEGDLPLDRVVEAHLPGGGAEAQGGGAARAPPLPLGGGEAQAAPRVDRPLLLRPVRRAGRLQDLAPGAVALVEEAPPGEPAQGLLVQRLAPGLEVR